jgi:hypothetical protein
MVIEVKLTNDEGMKVAFAPQGVAVKDKDTEDDATFAVAVAGVCLLAREAGLKQTLEDLGAACKEVMDNSI